MAERPYRAIRVIVGILLMGAFVAVSFAVVTRYAGAWGVPFFSFTSARGSSCTNTMTGYTCSPLTLADLEFYSDVDLPPNTRVISGTYTATHDYHLEASLRVPPASSAAALKALQLEFGGCQADHPPPMSTTGLRNVCVLANDDAVTEAGDPPSRLYVVGTGVAGNGIRVISMSIRSR